MKNLTANVFLGGGTCGLTHGEHGNVGQLNKRCVCVCAFDGTVQIYATSLQLIE